jgi:hypothetical protein
LNYEKRNANRDNEIINFPKALISSQNSAASRDSR